MSSQEHAVAAGPRQVPRPSHDAAWAAIDGETVVLDVRGNMLRGLNATGGRVWALIDGRRTVEEIARDLARETGEPEPRVLADVAAFVGKLRALGLVDVEGGTYVAPPHEARSDPDDL